jgi:hypothetical protein
MRAVATALGSGLGLVFVCLSGVHGAYAQTAPKKYQDLYRELDAQLSSFERRLPPRSSGAAPTRAATLLSANCHRGESMLSDAQREATLRELDALKGLGAEGIVLEICYPLLTRAFRDPQPFIEYYANLANEIHVRGLQLVVEHNSLLPAYASIDIRPYYKKLTKQRFGRERYAELKTILLALNPEYLTLVSEPRTHTAGLNLTVNDWRTYVQRSVETLSEQLGSFPTQLGAGSGLWDDSAFIEAFSAIKGLNYIDLHLYPLTSGGESNLERLLAWPDRMAGLSPRLDWKSRFQLEFEPPDLDRFPALRLGFEVARRGGTCGAVLNAANEAAVERFLNNDLAFCDIPRACRAGLEAHEFDPSPTLAELLQHDRRAREEIQRWKS